MKVIKVLGPGCSKCKRLTRNVSLAVEQLGLACAVEKVTDIQEMIAQGVMATPALVVDGELVSVGKVLTVEHVKILLLAR